MAGSDNPTRSARSVKLHRPSAASSRTIARSHGPGRQGARRRRPRRGPPGRRPDRPSPPPRLTAASSRRTSARQPLAVTRVE